MGRIKSTLIKKTARNILKEKPSDVRPDFEHNKRILNNTMPDKKTRNKVAGYLTRLVTPKKARTRREIMAPETIVSEE